MEILINGEALTERFMRYVQVDTQSDPRGSNFPTSENQKDLSRILCDELLGLGLKDAETNDFGYVYGTIPSTSSKDNVPVICFCAHVDTAPDCSGTNVKPILHKAWNGEDIILPDDNTQVLSVQKSAYLKNHLGQDIITASGHTLLGADDKAGVAVIMQAAAFLLQHPEIKHGDIKIVFTPDEEVGKGTAKIDIEKIGAICAYTLDGGEAGSLEDETFSADGATMKVHGIIAHPGYAKDKLVNAIKLAAEIVGALPKDEWSPETTDKKSGFVHPVAISGNAEHAEVNFIVRDFDTAKLADHHARLEMLARQIIDKYPGTSLDYKAQEQYRNMKEVLAQHPGVAANAAEAIRRTGLTVKTESIRGGTDGSRLSFMGLPCPNIFTGMQNIHSKLEWVGVQDMVKAAETIVHLCTIWEEKTD
ncbi:MAG: peptidase T [Ferruginibacter sp.]